ncbi:sulfatase-like hydrolase/transferase [Thermodesulfobacteriota bacterium]
MSDNPSQRCSLWYWGWGDISVQGSTTPTPRIDALTAEGIRFTNFNVQNQCTPTRSAIHTGWLPIRSGTQKVAAPGEPDGLSPWEYTIAELLSDAGYTTAAFTLSPESRASSIFRPQMQGVRREKVLDIKSIFDTIYGLEVIK